MLTRHTGGCMEPQGFSFVACRKTKWHSRSGRQLGTSLRNEVYSTIRSRRHPPWHLLKWVENICAYKCLHRNAHNSLSHHCQTSEAAEICYSRWIHCVTRCKGISDRLQRNELLSHEKGRKNFPCILVSERCQGKDRVVQLPTNNSVAKVKVGEDWCFWEDFKAAKLLIIIHF